MTEIKRLKAGIGVTALAASLCLYSGNTQMVYASESDSDSSTDSTVSSSSSETVTSDDDSILSYISSKVTKITIGGNSDSTDDSSSDSDTSEESSSTKNVNINITGFSHDKTFNNEVNVDLSRSYNTDKNYDSTSDSTTTYSSTKSTGSTSTSSTTSSTGSTSSSSSSKKTSSSDDSSSKSKGALSTLIETIEDEEVPLGNDYLSSDWTMVGEVAPTCTEDGYANYYNATTGELQKVVEKATGHDYVTEIEDGGLFHKDTSKTYCKNCGEVVSEDQVGSDFSIGGALAALASLFGAIFLKKH